MGQTKTGSKLDLARGHSLLATVGCHFGQAGSPCSWPQATQVMETR